ncbi:extensin family protein [Pendulispora rubella]|uniref:Extensin family protein n=1 Tax=Pendulispora rubella TaxID=2741070 RepID=A0ABZ2L5K4_9BACT
MALFRQGWVPAAVSPVPSLDLEAPSDWFVDWQLAALKRDRMACERILRQPWVDATPVADRPLEGGCGWENAVRFSKMGDVSISVDRLSCEEAGAFALWIARDVQPLAESFLGRRVRSIGHMGTYACRNVVGTRFGGFLRSEHASANAIDIGSFTLADGRTVSVAKHWGGDGPESRFLHAVHDGACRYFRVVLGPDYNAAHRDHFHLDRGPFPGCH